MTSVGTTINITGNSNDSNLVLGSSGASIVESEKNLGLIELKFREIEYFINNPDYLVWAIPSAFYEESGNIIAENFEWDVPIRYFLNVDTFVANYWFWDKNTKQGIEIPIYHKNSIRTTGGVITGFDHTTSLFQNYPSYEPSGNLLPSGGNGLPNTLLGQALKFIDFQNSAFSSNPRLILSKNPTPLASQLAAITPNMQTGENIFAIGFTGALKTDKTLREIITSNFELLNHVTQYGSGPSNKY